MLHIIPIAPSRQGDNGRLVPGTAHTSRPFWNPAEGVGND